jgi:hypothetical protein
MILRAIPVLRRSSLVAAATSLALLARAPNAGACACCSEPGQRIEGVSPLSSYEKGELGRLRFAKAAKLYLTAAGFDAVNGIRDPASAYEVGVARQGDLWTFTFKDGKNNAGTLAFTLPPKIESFFVDTHDQKQAGAGGPLLYKEWRLAAPVAGTGIFTPGMAGNPTARLILHGRGNACTSVEQLTAWTLVVSGPKADYTLYGSLSTPASTP